MKFSVFCSEKHKTELPQLRLALDEFYIEYQTLLFSSSGTLSDILPTLKQVLSGTTLYLIIPSVEDFSSQWISVIAGYSRFDSANVLVYAPEGSRPDCLADFSISKTLDELMNQIRESMPEWTRMIKEQQANITLEEHMKEHTHQNFVKAVSKGDRFLTGVFLDAGFQVNKLSSEQVSLLAIAARNGYTAIAEILCEAGADVNLISLDRHNTPLMDAASEGHAELVRFFIDKGASLDIKSKNGQTALILATGNQQIDCAEILIKAGADCDQKDSMGLSARKYAQLYQMSDLLEKMPPAP
ncbi:MAG: ankyrin repeat domain-containing protein [Spirochaetales bacterium]|nr:ankyrin repeat domain-containing protein [Spirochaetales bacterium]